MSQFIGTSMTTGFAGQVSRGFYDHTVETHKNDGTVKEFGVAVKIVGKKVGATSAASDAVYGFAVREFGQADMQGKQGMDFLSVLRRGYIVVKVTGGTAALGGKVYLNASGVISADSSGNTAIPGATFMGAADASGLAEIAFNI